MRTRFFFHQKHFPNQIANVPNLGYGERGRENHFQWENGGVFYRPLFRTPALCDRMLTLQKRLLDFYTSDGAYV